MDINDAIEFFDTATKLNDFSECWDCIRKELVKVQKPSYNKQSTPCLHKHSHVENITSGSIYDDCCEEL